MLQLFGYCFRPKEFMTACAVLFLCSRSVWAQACSPQTMGFGTGVYKARALASDGGALLAGNNIGVWRWDGTKWTAQPMNGGVLGVRAIVVGSGGETYIGGTFYLPNPNGPSISCGIGKSTDGTYEFDASGPTAHVHAVLVLSDGRFAAGGTFKNIGSAPGAGIALLDASWQSLGGGVDGHVNALAEDAQGNIIAGGLFTSAGGEPRSNIALWNGSTWSAMGDGFDGEVFALTRLPGGDIVAGGAFKNTGAASISGVARWDGYDWRPLGAGIYYAVYALATGPDGALFAGGFFHLAGGQNIKALARWNGTSWAQVGTGLPWSEPHVFALASFNEDYMVACGPFIIPNHPQSIHIAAWKCVDCYSDCDLSGSLDFFDYVCFQNAYLSGLGNADCDGNGAIEPFDFLCFQNTFSGGCP